jgi:hypothetical protein
MRRGRARSRRRRRRTGTGQATELHSRAGPQGQGLEDVLQDVFFELLEANRRLMPIDQVTGWLFQVARNRITELGLLTYDHVLVGDFI